jgi:Peptidase family M1 domain
MRLTRSLFVGLLLLTGAVALDTPVQAAACGTEVIANGGFESGSSPWTASSGVIRAGTTGQPAHGGAQLALLGGHGVTATDTLNQSVTVPSGCSSMTLTYWLHIDTRETTTTTQFDKLTVKAGSTTLATYSNLNKNTGYLQRSVNVSSFVGQTFTLTFTGTEDSSLLTNFVLDDISLTTGTGTPSDSTRTPGLATYTLNLTSNSTGFTWTGHETISFTNLSPVALPEVYLRLWDNFHGSCPSTPITVTNVTGGTPSPLSVACTAMKITLPAPLAQNQSGTIGFDLSLVVPSGADRFGHDGNYTFIGNALPVLAVRDGGGWHLDPYTNNGESFYQLISNYDVTLTHPASLLTPATGTSTETVNGGNTITHATATNVREFAWAAGAFAKTTSTNTDGVVVNVYRTSAITATQASSMMTTAKNSLVAHASRFGAYPYGEVDVVLDNNFWFGGMEYPGFVLDVISSTALAHELAHQWFYGIVGDDEYNNPWLDEGFTDYATDLYRGITGSGCGITWQSSAEKLTNSMAYWDAHSSRYGAVIYGYGKCTLHDLRRLIGDTAMANLLRNYAQSHWYGISTVADFKAAAQAAAGSTDLTSFWANHRVEG